MEERTVDDVLDQWTDAWRERSSDVPFERWRAECDDAWADDAVIAIEDLDTPDWRSGREARDALAAKSDAFFPALALALRDPRHNVWTRVLDALITLGPARRAELEAALLSLIVQRPPPAYEGAPPLLPSSYRAMAEHPWSQRGSSALGELARAGDVIAASSAALLLSQPAQLEAGLNGLRAWSARDDLPDDIAAQVLEHTLPAVETLLRAPRSGKPTLERLRNLLAR